jgi:hypothetical protein
VHLQLPPCSALPFCGRLTYCSALAHSHFQTRWPTRWLHAPFAPMHGHPVRSPPDAADTAPLKGAQSLNCAVHAMEETSAPPDSAVTHLDLFMHALPKVRFLCSCRSVSTPFPVQITASLLACTRPAGGLPGALSCPAQPQAHTAGAAHPSRSSACTPEFTGRTWPVQLLCLKMHAGSRLLQLC